MITRSGPEELAAAVTLGLRKDSGWVTQIKGKWVLGMMETGAGVGKNEGVKSRAHIRVGETARRVLFFLAPLAVVLALMPTLGAIDLLYPDLVADWGEHDEFRYEGAIDDSVVTPAAEIQWNGKNLLVVRFDGFVTNIGDGPLRIAGNPTANNVHQYILKAGGNPTNPNDYQQGPAVTLVYETDDGHNHWHLKNAQEYALWNEAMTQQVTVGSKVGFCLYDIGRVRETAGPQYYNTASVDLCAQNNPSSTAVEMGVTQGWKDVYRSSVSQQWVDVSAVAPGNYRLSSRTDVSNQIVEKDETNNIISFHPQTVTVPGYLPQNTASSTARDTTVAFTLPAATFGTPGAKAFTMISQPTHGTVTVTAAGMATYTPEIGFKGTDSFEFSVHDSASPYPSTRPKRTATIVVGGSFDDVPADHPFFAEITWLAGQKITNGCGAATFCPDMSMTRGQLASFIVRAFDLPAGPAGSNRFTDDNGSPHEADIEALAAAGITTGCAAEAFCPEDPVTRAEWASFFVRTLFGTSATSQTNPFSDDDGSVHEGSIGVLWDQGLTRGCGLGVYCPDAPVTRGQLAAFLYRQLSTG